MNHWQQVIQTALIGTDKQSVPVNDIGEDLLPAITAISNNIAIDKEEQFLQIAATVFNYRQSGAEAMVKQDISIAICGAETLPYCSKAAMASLKDILHEDSNGLLALWLQYCSNKQQVVEPALLPLLFDKAVQQKQLRQYAPTCFGKRGAWLSQFNSEWNFATDASDEALWQTGTPDQRKKTLQQLRATNAAQAREWLQQTWPQENAASKQNLLEAFAINLSAADVPWLESLTNEKSQKVKEDVLGLLKQVPTSTIVQQYIALLQQSISIKKEKTMFGLSSKQVLQIALPSTIDEQLTQSGMEKLSNQKEFTDDEFILFQLLQNIPPSVLEAHLQLLAGDIIELLQKEDSTKKFLPAIVMALVKFHDTAWAIACMQHSTVFYLDILPLIPVQQQEYYSKKFFKGNEHSIVQYAVGRATEWSVELTQLIFTHTAANHYQYYRNFYNQHIQLIPYGASSILDACNPLDEYASNSWNTTKEYIAKLLELKQQTIQSFN